MGIFKKLFGKEVSRDKLSKEEIIEAGVCPNCWGKQEYDNKFLQFVEDQTKANINHDKFNKKAFVAQFVETNITGIRLKTAGVQSNCSTCKTQF